jgi:hydroxyacylglutathione hydrolase
MSYELGSEENGDVHSVFTGDSVFVNSAGRPDLLGKDADKLAAQLYETVHGYFGGLGDGVIIHPSHGSGSPCGADIGERLESTIGYEKAHNPYFQLKEKGEFVKRALESAPPEPTYYKRMKRVNAAGPEVLGRLPVVPALPIGKFSKEVEIGERVLVDTRHMLAFGGGHISGALSIGATPMLTIWAGWLLDPERSILLVLEKDSAVEEVTSLFVRAGFTKFAGYLAGGMTTWDNKGHPLERLPQMTVHEVRTCSNDLQVVDVRTPQERAKGHIPCSKHLFAPEIADKSGSLRKDQPVVTYCASGYRASIAASILQAEGFSDVRTMPGSWKAWQAAGLPVSTEETAP